jgi:acetylornithine deacetylase/succinyl-diaminopimelate desuccinylase-like protein
MSELSRLLADLVRIDSVNPGLVPGGSGEGEIAQYVASWLEHVGVDVTMQETAPGRPNVIGRVRGRSAGRTLMLNAHMDTVGYAGMASPLDPRIEGNRLYGRGAFDMKGSLAAIMLAAARLAVDLPNGDVLITAVTDEEFASIGTEAIAREYRADGAIVTEPSELELCVAHKGFAWVEIETSGVAAHGSLPDAGVDAITMLAPVLEGIQALGDLLRAGEPHPLLGTGSLHASLIEGGMELSTYPERALLSVERRTVPGETTELIDQQFRSILDSAQKSWPNFNASYRRTFTRNAYEADLKSPIFQVVAAQAEKLLGRAPAVTGTFGWMDSSILGEAGIPTVIYGPGGAGAHAIEEWVDLDDCEYCVELFVATAKEFCA